MGILFIFEGITQLPTDNEFVSTIEQKEGKVADRITFPGTLSVPGVSLLIGSDLRWTLTSNEVGRCKGDDNLRAINTSFAWTFSGSTLTHNFLIRFTQTMTCFLRDGSLMKTM